MYTAGSKSNHCVQYLLSAAEPTNPPAKSSVEEPQNEAQKTEKVGCEKVGCVTTDSNSTSTATVPQQTGSAPKSRRRIAPRTKKESDDARNK